MRSSTLAAAGGLALLATACGYGYYPYDYYYPYDVVGYPGVYVDPYGYCYDPYSCGCYDPYSCGFALTAAPGQAQPSAAAAPASCDPQDALCRLRRTGTALNYYLRAALEPAGKLLDLEPSGPAGGARVFGPLDLSAPGAPGAAAATFRLTVARAPGGESRWKLEAKPVGGPDSGYRTVLTGSLARAGDPHEGGGVLGVDLDAFAAVNPAVFTGAGKLLAAYAGGAGGRATAFRLQGFRVEAGSDPFPDSVLVARTAGDQDRLRLARAGEAAGSCLDVGRSAPAADPVACGESAGPAAPAAPPAAMPDPGF